jgi:hypothetical protein
VVFQKGGLYCDFSFGPKSFVHIAILGSFGSQAKKSSSRPRRRHENSDEIVFYLSAKFFLGHHMGASVKQKGGLVIAIALGNNGCETRMTSEQSG